jgi:hypothetical protein
MIYRYNNCIISFCESSSKNINKSIININKRYVTRSYCTIKFIKIYLLRYYSVNRGKKRNTSASISVNIKAYSNILYGYELKTYINNCINDILM